MDFLPDILAEATNLSVISKYLLLKEVGERTSVGNRRGAWTVPRDLTKFKSWENKQNPAKNSERYQPEE